MVLLLLFAAAAAVNDDDDDTQSTKPCTLAIFLYQILISIVFKEMI